MKINLIPLFLILTSACYSQPVITNESLTDPTLNIVYIDVDNEILVSGTNVTSKDSIVALNCKLIRKSANKFILRPASGDSSLLYYYQKDSILLRKALVNRPVPKPAARFGNITSIRSGVKEVLDNPTVTIFLPGCFLKHSYVPVRYRFKIQNDYTNYKYSKLNYGNRLNKEQLDLVSLCPANTSLIIDEVVITDKKGYKGYAMSGIIIVQ